MFKQICSLHLLDYKASTCVKIQMFYQICHLTWFPHFLINIGLIITPTDTMGEVIFAESSNSTFQRVSF